MQPLLAHEIKGTWGTLLLPINEDDSIDYGRLEVEIDALIEAKVDGIYSNGTAGEFYTQTETEFDRVNQLLAERCEKAGMPFQIGASHTSPQTCLERVRRAVNLRPSAIQVILPDWVPVTLPDALFFLERITRIAEPMGIVLYNPPHAKRVFTPAEFGELKQHLPGLVGVKVAGGDADWYGAMREKMQGLSVFVPGHHLATGVKEGAVGAYSNVACLHPWGSMAWNKLMHSDLASALEIQGRIQRFMNDYIIPYQKQGYANPALDKLLAAIGGWAPVGTRLRWPYRWIPEEAAINLRPVAKRMIPELFPG